MKTLVFTIIASLFLSSATHGTNLDFIAETMDGKPYDLCTLDSATDLFGRPEESKPPGVITKEGLGVVLFYHAKGILLRFEHPEKNPKQRLIGMVVFLVSGKNGGMFSSFKAFEGKLSRGVDANWKLAKFLDEFRADGQI